MPNSISFNISTDKNINIYPKDKLPESPIKIDDGYKLNIRNDKTIIININIKLIL